VAATAPPIAICFGVKFEREGGRFERYRWKRSIVSNQKEPSHLFLPFRNEFEQIEEFRTERITSKHSICHLSLSVTSYKMTFPSQCLRIVCWCCFSLQVDYLIQTMKNKSASQTQSSCFFSSSFY
jgi:hypothetical protein